MNPLIQSFVGSLRSRYAVDDGKSTISEWIMSNTSLKGKPFSFEKYAFQRQIADDEHRNLVCRKCSQVGLTETQLRKFLALLMRTNGLSGIFTLPSDELFKRIWAGRMKPLLDGDKVFRPRDDDETWTKRQGMFQLDHSLGYVTGCGEDDATSTPADFLMHDELDLSPMDMIALYQSRLQNSDYKVRQSFSTPTHIDYGIDGGFKNSDQHEFLIRCDCCGHQQIPEFTPQYVHLPKSNSTPDLDFLDFSVEQIQLLTLTDAFVGCSRCQAPLDLGNGDLREWVPRFPERTMTRGYQVTPFSNNRVSVLDIFTQLAEYKRLDNIRGFHNTVLGQPFTPANARLKRAEVEACFINDPPAVGGNVHLGVDLGGTCHVVLGTPAAGGVHVFYWATVKADNLLQHIRDLRDQYPGLRGAGDRQPYTTEMNAIRQDSHRQIWPVLYTPGNTPRIRPVKDETGEVDYYQGNRTAMIDYAAGMIRRKRLAISGAESFKEVIIEHFCDMVRDEQPEKPATWVKLTGNDHFMHALGFMLFSMKIAEAEEYFSGVAPGSIVLTEGAPGWGSEEPKKRVYNPFDRR